MKIIIGILLAFFVTFSVGTAFGHGAGIEASPLVFTNDREIKVTVELLPSDFYKSDEKMIKIDAYDHTNRETITNASFKVEIFNDNQLLLDEWFYTQDGNLILQVDPDVIVTSRDSIEISGEKNNFGMWEKSDGAPLIITGPIFDKGGIYTFKIKLDAQDEIGIISDIEEVEIDEDTKSAKVIVKDNQLSLAIGKEGQNARLAAKLTGYKIDIEGLGDSPPEETVEETVEETNEEEE